MDDQHRYDQLHDENFQKWESACRRCGACCGVVDGDPCSHLIIDGSGQYQCAIYESRFGMHRTIGGREFMCVPIRNILHEYWPGDAGCAYKKRMRSLC